MPTFGSYKGTISPLMAWSANYSYTRTSNSNVQVTLIVTGNIINTASTSFMGVGNNVVVTATVGSLSQTYEMKSSSSTWAGNTNDPRSHTFTFNVASSAAGQVVNVSYSVAGAGYTAAARVPTQKTTFSTPALLYTASTPSMGTGTMGSPITIGIKRMSTSLTHTLTYSFGSATGTIGTGVAASVSWTPPLSLASQVPNSTSGTGTITCKTYAGSTLIGTKSISIRLNVPTSIVPTCSLALTLVRTSEPAAWGLAVQNYTKVKCVSTAAGAYGSTIKSYRVTGGGYTGTSSNFTTSGPLKTAGTNTFTLTVTDSRGRTKTATASVTVYAYSSPKIASCSAVRANSAGTATNNGTYIKATVVYNYNGVNSKNTASCTVSYRLTSSSTFTGATTIASGGTVTIGGGAIAIGSSYVVRFTLHDGIKTVTRDVNINTVTRSFHIKKGGMGVAFGKIAETNNMVESAWHVRAPFYSVSSIGRPWINLNGVSGQYGINLANSDVINARRIIFGTEADGDEGLFFPKEGKDINDKDTESYMRLRAYRDKIYFRDSTGEHRVIHTGDLMNTPYFKFNSDRFWFATEGDSHQYALHLNNSDVVGANGIVFNDAIEMSTNGGIWFPYANKTMNSTNMGDYMRLWAYEGVLYFRNGSAGAQTNNVVYHAGNIRNFASSGAGWMKVGSYKVCWGTVKIAYACETASGSIYYGNATRIDNQNFASAFSAKPVCVMTLKTMSAGILGIDAFDVQSGGIANVRLKRATPYTDTSGIEAFYVAYGPA